MRDLFREVWLPQCLAIGISEKQFWDMTVRDIKPYAEAERIRHKHEDRVNYMLGGYIYHAVAAAVENVFKGQKAKLKYLKQPFSEMQEQNNELSENEKREMTHQLFHSLEIMQINFERNKKNKPVS